MLKKKYGDHKMIKFQNEIREGDIIAYFCDSQQKEVKAEVLALLEPIVDNVIICRRLDEDLADLIDFNKVPVYLVSSKNKGPTSIGCECGALYTSNPRFHLSYCPLSDEMK